DLTIDDFNTSALGIPLIANLQPSGRYFMEDLYYAGGIPAVMKELDKSLYKQTITVSGKPMADNYKNADCFNRDVIATVDQPFNKLAGISVLKGNICEHGAVIKPSAATPALMQHTGKAVVFENIDDYKSRVDDPDLEIDETCVMVLKNVGPKGYPGMPEVGNMNIPKKLLDKGVHDMVRLSDGRMSGTGFGTVVLHVSPEAAAGGTLAVIRDGDVITLDVYRGILNVDLSDHEIAERKKQLQLNTDMATRGYVYLYQNHVEQAHLGADLDFLKGGSGSEIHKDSH
ncbi:MAG: dihydroxy-acid dehydratase domain-containing protein, partial [Mucilaginibacter sp.]